MRYRHQPAQQLRHAGDLGERRLHPLDPGFEPLDVMQAILMLVRQINEGRHEVENQYTRAVKPGEDLRAGRWWWESPGHKECGLHRPTEKGA